MKAKLKKTNGKYSLWVGIDILANTLNPDGFKHKLSLKNCQAIERGYDLDELADDFSRKFPNDSEPIRYASFIIGFQKALEILGDKKFSEEDMKKAYLIGCDKQTTSSYHVEKNIQSLQTEWDCIVEMECCGNYDPPCNINCGYGPKPKLDADGCLILKRV